MKGKTTGPKQISDRALEMIMRDVLDGMAELAFEYALRNHQWDAEIIQLNPPTPCQRQLQSAAAGEQSSVIQFSRMKRATG